MGQITYPKPVKLIFSIISSKDDIFTKGKHRLIEIYGPIDMESEYQLFDFTDYYKSEMGNCLKQKLVTFEKLITPDMLSQIKCDSNHLELQLSMDNKNIGQTTQRKVNFDPGYLTLGKFVLASTKNGAARIYLNQGIYSEITLRYVKKSFSPLEWTYRNYKTDLFIEFLNKVREKYKIQLKEIPKNNN
jgi:hypothetical protein